MHRNSSRKVKAVRDAGKSPDLMGCFLSDVPSPWCSSCCCHLALMCQFVHRVSRQRGAALHFVLTLVTLSKGTGSTALGRVEDVEHLEQQVGGGWQTSKWTLSWRGAHPTELWPDWHAGTTSLGSLQLALPPLCSRIMASENNRKIGEPPLRFDLPELKTACSALSQKVKDSRPRQIIQLPVSEKAEVWKVFLLPFF